MNWRTMPLDAIKAPFPYSFVGGPFGSNLTTRDYVDEGIPVIRGNNLPADTSFSDHEFAFVSEKKADDLRSNTAFPGDLVFTQRGTLGQVGLIPHESRFQRYIISQSQMKLTVNPRIADPRFVYYFFRLPTTVQKVVNHALTSGVPHINLGILREFKITLPDVDCQQHIADILSAYDDLIENNRRRMAVLEEAARQLYREWFVRLHFPGHEHTRITNGVPEEWCQSRFEQVLAALESGGRPRGGAKTDHGIPSIGAENVLSIGRYDYSKEKFVPEEYYEKMTRGVIRNRDVVLYKDGANIGRTSYFGDGFPHLKCAVNEHVFILRAHPSVGQSFLYFWLTRDENRQAIENLNANTAQPGISQEKLKGLKVLLPPEWLTRAFNEAVEALVKQIFTLALMSRKLSAARDLLLPRLMSGEIAV